MMRGNKVFLAIDNISDTSESIKESKLYLNAVCSGYESRILLTARSLGILRRLIAKEETSFMHVPGLEEEEAMAVLLQLTPVQVSRLTCVEKEVARKCIQKCRFTWYCGDGKEYLAYHPLVLKTFGAYLYDKFESSADLSRWIDIPNLSNTRMGPLQEIFSMFEESLRGLSPEYLTVFMLLCLFLPEPHMPYDSILAWLAIVCDGSPEEIEYVVTIKLIIQLKNKGFIEKGYKLYIHDLFMDFSQSHANGTGKWILLKNADEIPVRLQQPLPNDRSRFEAMKLDNCLFQSLAGINYDLLSNVSVLHLQDVAILRTLDLRPTKMVRSLAIIDCCQLEEIQGIEGLSALGYFIVKGCCTDLQLRGVECLMSLRHLEVHLEDSNQKSLKHFTQWLPPLGIGDLPKCDLLQYPKLRGLRNLRTVDLVYAGRGSGVLDFAGCSNLDVMQLSRCSMTGLVLTGCSQVRVFNLHFCDNLTAPVHFDELTGLQTLRLSQFHMALPNLDVCTGLTTLALTVSDLEELPCIGGLTHLSTLCLSEMGKLKKLPSLSQLSNLRLLELKRMRNLEELPTFSGLTNLCDLVLSGMPNLKELPSFTELTNLSQIGLEGMKSLMELPCIGGLTHLSRLWLLEMGKLKKLPGLSQLSNLSNLLLEGMPNLEEIPTFSGLTNLCDLSLRGMPNLKELPSFTEFSNLSRLTLDGMKSLMELPIGLGSLTNLKSVELKGMPNLEELPTATNLCNLDLRGMPNLKELPCIGGLTPSSTLWLSEREKLKKLPSLSQLSNLLDLRLDGMPNLEELPTFRALTNLRHLVLRGMPSLKQLPSFTELTKLELLILEGMKSLMELPISLGSLTNLRSLALEGMPNLTELPKLSGLTNLNELRLHEMDSLRELPSLGALTPLSLLSLRGMPNLAELPSFTGFTNLIHLRILKMQNLQGLPCLSGLTDLFELALAGMPSLKELPSLDGLSSLDSLVLEGMRNLEEIPSFRGLANLSSLEMGSMQSLKKLPTLSGLTGLGRFEMMNMPQLVELVSLSNLTNLSELLLIDCGITEPPDLTNCHQLRRIVIRQCENLRGWPTLSGLNALRTLTLTECRGAVMHPDLSGCPQHIEVNENNHIEWKSTYSSQWLE